METEIQHANLMGCNKSGSKRKVRSYTGIPQETRKISNSLTLPLRNQRKKKTAQSQKEGNDKDESVNK